MPTENPYAAPTAVGQVESGPGSDRDWLRKIAAAQRHTNIAVLCYLCLIPANVAIQMMDNEVALALFAYSVFLLGVLIFGAISVFRLASLFRGPVVAVIYVLGLLIPLLGLILIVSLSSKATKVLRENGIRVGLMGADMSSL